MDGSMGEILGISTVLKLAQAAFALWLLGWLLRKYDRQNGIVWKTAVWDTMKTDPRALALYFGLRFAGACLLVGQILR